MAEKHRVLIMRCSSYDPDRIEGIIREGMQTLGVKPAGRILLKPNTVLAHPKLFRHAFTRKEFLDGALGAVRAEAREIDEIGVGERCGITVPTRHSFRDAGYLEVIKKHKAKAYYFDETRQVTVTLKRQERLRDTIFVPKPVSKADFLINLPKFKSHPWCRMTLSLKNFIGLQDDRHRLVDHNSYLEHKIADLQEVIQPKFIAIDGIVAGQNMMLTPDPFDLGAILMGTNSCAVDTVGCHMVHLDPRDLIHLKYASERGFGPMDLDAIEVGGDFPLDEVRSKTVDFQISRERIDRYFNGKSRLTCVVGRFPEDHSPDYCWGGCPGALQEAMEINREAFPDVDQTMRRITYVVGDVDKPLEIEDDTRVFFAGDCTQWKGRIDGKDVTIEKNYRSLEEVDEKKTRSNDMILQTLKAMFKMLKNRKSRCIRVRGCPVSVADHIHYLSLLGRIKNANFLPYLVIPVNIAYWKMRLSRAFNRIFG